MPKVSIIIPTYNSSLFIKRTIESVIDQTFKDWELLIADDCSTDETFKIVEEIAKENNKIKIFKTPKNSGGPALSKNIAMEKAQGEYIAFLDHDDEWLPEKLEKQIEYFKENKDKKIGLVSCGANLINEKGICFSQYNPNKVKYSFPDILLRNPIYSNSSVMIKREVIDLVGGRDTDMKYSEDWDMWIRIAKAGYDLCFVNQILFNYHFHSNNVTKAKKDKLIKVRDAEYVFYKHNDLYEKYNYLHVGHFRLGVMYFMGREYKKSRKCYKESLRIKHLFIPSMVGYVLSLFGIVGIWIVNLLIFLYRLVHGRTYLIKIDRFSN